MALFTCRFDNKTGETVVMRLVGADHEYVTDPIPPHKSETTDDDDLIVGSPRTAIAFKSATGGQLATANTTIAQDTVIILRQNTNGDFKIEFAGLVLP